MARAIEANPDYLSRRKQIESSRIRLAYAQNQRWPQLDLKASYGLNGIGDSPSSSFDQITHSEFPAWSLGVELRIPLAGGIKSRAELAGAKLGSNRAYWACRKSRRNWATPSRPRSARRAARPPT